LKVKISPSVLDSDFTRIGATLKMLEKNGIEYIHFDVMDGNFVPNLTFGAKLIKQLRPLTSLIFDTHLMINRPERYINTFIDAGCDIVTVHSEATRKTGEIIKNLHSAGRKAGLSIKPGTPVSSILKHLPALDLVLVMSVEPGFGGQKFMEGSLSKVRELRKLIDSRGYNCLIEIDGGVNASNVSLACEAGIDIFVAGSAIFGSKNPQKAIKELHAVVKRCALPRQASKNKN